ncbi:uncharacterized protein FOMMEDRAFT_161403 [Fomitiporia mediterranea MF3/22]|uniref:uncharacterized protein n=1 Tax=Fomitiporia mediterranea (strain MF3/22) TaxID=694068 RepID=UPI0004408A4F|nr:uncharacterized protein FOMMEDRAFT_161403 [Fomitiporia mediterranea MF3/22]EJC98585.1 hypothetical protein FOMMEDRAFT_161403 [Fomitiporia mediterranea MF3/22]
MLPNPVWLSASILTRVLGHSAIYQANSKINAPGAFPCSTTDGRGPTSSEVMLNAMEIRLCSLPAPISSGLHRWIMVLNLTRLPYLYLPLPPPSPPIGQALTDETQRRVHSPPAAVPVL